MNEITKPKTIAENYDFKAVEGLHFNMTDEDYFAIPCLSATGLKMLKTNPSKFWWYSWMNPEKEDKSTEARIIGKAFHKRILEGKEAFYNEYAREFSCDRDDLITTGDDIKDALKAEKAKYPDIKTTFKSKNEGFELLCAIDDSYRETAKDFGVAEIKDALKAEKAKYPDIGTTFLSKQDGMEMLFDIDIAYRDRMFDELKLDYEKPHAGKIFLSDWIVDRAELCAKVVENHPYLKTAFIGGYSEVSCIWFDKDLGVWFKCRYDYLKVSAINDLKTFTRMTDKEIERFLPDQISKYGYNIQATHYMDSLPYAKKFAKDGKVFDFKDDDAWLKAFASRPCDQFHFVFQQKEEIPNAYEVIFSKNHAMYEASQSMIRHAVDEYKIYVDRYGDEMWAEIKQPQVLTDDDYPVWAY